MKYKKLRNARKVAENAEVDFTYVCCLLDSLQRVRNILYDFSPNARDVEGLTKIEESLITILDYIGVEFVIDDWEKVKRGEVE